MKNVEKNQKIAKSVNFETPYKNLEKYGSFSELRTSTEKSVMLATLCSAVCEFRIFVSKGDIEEYKLWI